MYFLFRNHGDSRWQLHLGKKSKTGNLISAPKLSVFFFLFFFLTYWTMKSPDLGATELDDLKRLLAVKPLAIRSISNNIFLLGCLLGQELDPRQLIGGIENNSRRCDLGRECGIQCVWKGPWRLVGSGMGHMEREVLRSRNKTCPSWLNYHLEVERTWDHLTQWFPSLVQ